MLWFIIIVFGAYLVYTYAVDSTNYWKKKGVPQVKEWPLVGSFPDAIVFRKKSFFDMFKEIYSKFPQERYHGINFFGRHSLMITDLELIKQVTVKDFDHFTDHNSIVPEEVDPLLGKNLFSMKGQKWREMRATLSPAFTSSKMRAMYVLMLDCAKDVSIYLVKKSKGQMMEIEMKDLFTRYTNDVIATSSFGIKCDSLKEPNNKFYLLGKKITNFEGFWNNIIFLIGNTAPSILKFFNISVLAKDASSFFRKIVLETIETREQNNIVRPDMINLLIEAKKGKLKHEGKTDEDAGFATVQESDIGKTGKIKTILSDDDMVAQAMIFFLAGFETVSTVLSFAAVELGINTDVQRKLQEEIIHTWNSCEGNVTYEIIMKMKYLDQVISEALRKWTPAFQLDRVCVKDYVIEPKREGETTVYIKKGDLIGIPSVGIHYDPKYFPNPNKFDPDRFNDENRSTIVPGSYMPFGGGPRNCIGSRFALLEIKVLLFHLLLQFDLELVKRSPVPIKISTKTVTLDVENGYWIGLRPKTGLSLVSLNNDVS